MKVITNASDCNLAIAIAIFNKYLEDGTIAMIIGEMDKSKMRYINVDPLHIASVFSNFTSEFTPEVSLYTPWRFSKAYATTYTGDYSRICLNSRKMNRGGDSLCGTIAHEWGHCLEFYWKKYINSFDMFNHGDNKRKDDTFQYQLGIRVKELVNMDAISLVK